MGEKPKDYDRLMMCILAVSNAREFSTRGKFKTEIMSEAMGLYDIIEEEIEAGRVAINEKPSQDTDVSD